MPEVDLAAPPTPYRDFRTGATWRIFRIMAEFIDGFEFLADLKREVSIFGSARVTEHDENYQAARRLGFLLGKAGYTVITGGGPGIMEAANRGAFEADGSSLGLNIQLPQEQRINPYVKKGIGFAYFFTRKVMLSIAAQAYVFFPGGFGTIDELSELIVLIQTGKSPRIPIVCVGKEYWEEYFAWVRKSMLERHEYISAEDMDIVQIVATPEEAFELVKKTKERPTA
jgi:uncharacterized protein (TIGR00730 family)